MINSLFRTTDNSPLVIFRAIFGLLIMLEAWGAILTGWVHANFIEPEYNFPFILFSFLKPLPGNGMIYYYLLMGAFGALVMVGFRYRFAMIMYALMWTGVYFMQKTSYNNHYYLLMLLCWQMCFVPAAKDFSLDARFRPQSRSSWCPQWCVWLFAAQIGIVYTYAGFAKLYPDWFQGIPVRLFFSAKQEYFLVGPLLGKQWLIMLVSWGGVLFDLLITPLLLWKKTRKYAFFVSIFFHLFNSLIFRVGIFPYLGIAFGIFFFPAAQIRKLFFPRRTVTAYPREPLAANPYITWVLAAYFMIQLLLPVRHWFYEGNVNWNEEGHRLSWRMMLRAKQGSVLFRIKTDSAEWIVRPTDYLTWKQSSRIATRPDMCWQFVQILKKDLQEKGISNPEIYAEGMVRLNNQPRGPLYNPETDLARVEWQPFSHAEWLLPLPNPSTPLKESGRLQNPEN